MFLPDSAFAWGFQTHLAIAGNILASAEGIIKTFPSHFMLGNIFPDFFLFLKDFSQYKRNLDTHTWKTVSALFSGARNDAERSFAHGYAAHLSADIVAHNRFVPQHLMYMGKGRMGSHLMLEYAEEALHNNRHSGTMMKLMVDAEELGGLFIREMNIDPVFFSKEMHTLRLALSYQKMFRLQRAVKAYKMITMPSFKEHCVSFRIEAEKLAGLSVSRGFQYLEHHDPTGKEEMEKARDKHDRLVKNVGLSKMKERYRNGDVSSYNPS
jgi:hypothetical protein